MKIYLITILQQYFKDVDENNPFNKDYVTEVVVDETFYVKKKKAIKRAKFLFNDLQKQSDIYAQELEEFIEDNKLGKFLLKTKEGNFLSVLVRTVIN